MIPEHQASLGSNPSSATYCPQGQYSLASEPQCNPLSDGAAQAVVVRTQPQLKLVRPSMRCQHRGTSPATHSATLSSASTGCGMGSAGCDMGLLHQGWEAQGDWSPARTSRCPPPCVYRSWTGCCCSGGPCSAGGYCPTPKGKHTTCSYGSAKTSWRQVRSKWPPAGGQNCGAGRERAPLPYLAVSSSGPPLSSHGIHLS